MARVVEPWESSQGTHESNVSNFDRLMSSFCESASRGDFAMVVYFMVRVNLDPLRSCGKRGWSGRTPLMIACIGGHDDCVGAMVCLREARQSLDLIMETRDEFGCTALDYACQYRSEKCISVLLHTGVPVDSAILPKYRALARVTMRKLGGLVGVERMASGGDEDEDLKGGEGTEKWGVRRRMVEFTYKVTPWSMAASFVGSFLYLLARLLSSIGGGGETSAGFSLTGLIIVQLMVTTVGLLVLKTIRSDAGVYVMRRDSDGNVVEYGEYIRRECLQGDAAATPVSKGFRVADTNAYRARLELTRAAINTHCCHICRCWRPAGTRHSSRTGKCISGFDHFCLFFAADVGRKNHRYFLLSVFGFNTVLPFLLMDMSLVLTDTPHLLWLPFAAIARLYSFFASSSFPSPVITAGHREALLATGCLWLWLIWVFVFLLLVQTLYKQTSTLLNLTRTKKEKKVN